MIFKEKSQFSLFSNNFLKSTSATLKYYSAACIWMVTMSHFFHSFRSQNHIHACNKQYHKKVLLKGFNWMPSLFRISLISTSLFCCLFWMYLWMKSNRAAIQIDTKQLLNNSPLVLFSFNCLQIINFWENLTVKVTLALWGVRVLMWQSDLWYIVFLQMDFLLPSSSFLMCMVCSSTRWNTIVWVTPIFTAKLR